MSEITQPEASAFKAKSIARGKLLERFRCHVQEVVEHAEDEGDRVYFGTSNHFEYLKEIADEMDMWGWDAVIRERAEVDPYADLRKVRDENRALTEERDRLRESLQKAETVIDLMADAVTYDATMQGPKILGVNGSAARRASEAARDYLIAKDGVKP
ncbi:hypothetical protein [Rhizobium leguminosarum]|uniref:hypothetical protein n=1 Tax=Rhizobium leguminosarum TaxID=384 RepID=UPI000B92A8CB|nr:hypothetical protein [Rhizobium leguminosarum]ASS55876.1 hypothetical protein CHR56_15610 [Rhizobium leguminosarum bv. viciae]